MGLNERLGARSALVISIVGASGAGKTTLIERLVPLLDRAGLSVGTVKHAPHGFDTDRPGSDSWRHARAGARTVLLAGPNGAATFWRAPTRGTDHGRHHEPTTSGAPPWLADMITTTLGHLDVVLAEGFAPVCDLVVEVTRAGFEPKRRTDRPVWARVTDTPEDGDEVGFDDVTTLARRICERRQAHASEPT